jgi:pyruvate formate lyase activating enzyme
VHWEDLAMLLASTDLVMMDIKHMDPAKHRWATGSTNERLLANARRLAETDKPILFRIPVIPTVNDTVEEVSAIAGYVRGLVELRRSRTGAAGSISLELLPFHRLAGDKYRSLGLEYRARGLPLLGKERIATLVESVRALGIEARGR